jgi:hypothetical protein
MRRYVVILMVLTLLSLPLVAGADDTTIPPEANWTPTPPASTKVDAAQLTEMLVRKGLLTPIEHSELTRSSAVKSAEDHRKMDRQDGREYATSP